jgi:hypothetical protein
LLIVVALALTLIACGGGADRGAAIPTDTPPPTRPLGANLLENPGFEEGEEPWFSLDSEAWGKPFTVSTRQAHSGSQSALLELRSDDSGPERTRVYGVVQEVSPEEFPEVLSGWYYVENWRQGTPKQYLQFVVVVFGAEKLPPEVQSLGVTNFQLRYVLAGVDEPPLQIGNARYVMVGAGEPKEGTWVYFERDIRQDFLDLWGVVPSDYDRIRVLFEVRWDERSPDDDPSTGNVYYDDLYLGPKRTGDGSTRY